MTRSILTLFALSAILNTGCPTRELSRDDPEGCGEQLRDVVTHFRHDVDILFVIDNSSSMAAEQAALVANFDRFIAVLGNNPRGLPNLHLGVVSTDVGVGPFAVDGCTASGDDGRMLGSVAPSCSAPSAPTTSYLTDIANPDGTRTTNYEGELSDAFACIAELGASGCGFEQPLEAMRRALDDRHSDNAGFLRPDALLLVIFITDEDDCSVIDDQLFDPDAANLGPLSSFRCFEHGVVCDPDQPTTPGTHASCRPRDDSAYFAPLAQYANFLRGLKAEPNMVMVAGIMGDSDQVTVAVNEGAASLAPACESATGEASPAIRLDHFLAEFPWRNTSASICDQDMSEALQIIADSYVDMLMVPCIDGDIDLEPETPGLQLDCTVSDITDYGTDAQVETLISECDVTPPAPGDFPCWTIVEEPLLCSDSATQAVLEVYRSPASTSVVHTVVRCFTGCSDDDMR